MYCTLIKLSQASVIRFGEVNLWFTRGESPKIVNLQVCASQV